jgi:hypothetical protein
MGNDLGSRARAIAAMLSVAALSTVGAAEPVRAQWRTGPMLAATPPALPASEAPRLLLGGQDPPRESHVLAVSLAGVGAAAVGSAVGAYLGYDLDYEVFHWGFANGCEDPGLLGILGGWFVGSALTTPLAVHLANGRRGSLASAYFPAAVIAGAGLAGLLVIGSPEGGIFLLAAPAAQVLSAVVTERRPRPER